MIFYLFIIIICCIGYIFTFKNDKAIGYILLGILSIFLSSGYMCGTDWPAYEGMYKHANMDLINQFSKEKGFFLYMLLFKSIGFNFWGFIIFNKLLVFISILSFLKEFDVKKSGFFLFFLVEIGFMLFIDNPLRNFIAFGISLFAIKQLIYNNNLKYVFLTAIAVSFHLSSLVLILFYLIKKTNISSKFILVSYLLIYFLSFNINFGLLEYVIPSDIYTLRIKPYLINHQVVRTSFYIGFIYRTATLILIILYKDQFKRLKNGQLVFNFAAIFFLIYPLSMSFVILQRLLYYSFPFMIIALLYSIKSIDKKIIKECIMLLLIFYSFIKLNSTLTQDSRYIPYTNYFYSRITNDSEPSIQERKLYNEKNSKYHKPKGTWE